MRRDLDVADAGSDRSGCEEDREQRRGPHRQVTAHDGGLPHAAPRRADGRVGVPQVPPDDEQVCRCRGRLRDDRAPGRTRDPEIEAVYEENLEQ